MADTQISNLPAASTLNGTEVLAGVQTGSSVKVSCAQIKTLTSASPFLVTPTLGVAIGTSVALGGATIGSDALGITGTASISGTVTLGVASSAAGKVILLNGTNANTTTIQSGVAAASRTYTWPTNFGASGTVLTDAAGNGTLSWAAAPPASAVTVGTTTIGSGTDTRILYDNAGTLGEYTLTGTGTVAVMQNTPTLTTPVLGVATGTSIALGGATIGTNALAVTGTVLFNTAVTMGAALTYGTVTLTNAVTGTGKMVLDGTPTLVTPVLGVATGTSIALNGATLGANKLAVTGTSLFTGVMVVTGGMGTTASTLTDGSTPALDASLSNLFTLSAAGDRTIAVPSNPTSGQKIVIRHLASGGARTLSLNTGAGGFRYGSDITGLTQTASGKIDYIGCIWNATDSFWDVVAYTKGF